MTTERHSSDQQQWLDLKDRALDVAAEGITIADVRLPGRPLIYVNEGFEKLTGYSAADALNRNCRFLQGEGTDPETVERIRRALNDGTDCTVEILNYRKDGSPFWNRLSISPVRDAEGRLTHFIGVQSDVTDRRQAESGLRGALQRIEDVNDLLRQDLEAAAEIQRAWLPDTLPRAPGFEFAWTFRPCQELGGDGLDIMRLDDEHIGFYILDVSGHGVPAALYSASVSRMLTPVPEQSSLFTPTTEGGFEISSPAEVAATLNRRLSFDPRTGRFFTLIYGVLNQRSRRLRYATAGHPAPLRCGPGGPVVCPAAKGVPIGFLEDFDYQDVELHLEPGDRLLFFSDGAFEVANDADQEYGIERLLGDLKGDCDAGIEGSLESIIENVMDWSPGHVLEDDVTLLAIEVLDPGD